MSEETATPAAEGTSAGTRRTTATTSRRRGAAKPADTTGPALPARRDDAFQAVRRVWPD